MGDTLGPLGTFWKDGLLDYKTCLLGMRLCLLQHFLLGTMREAWEILLSSSLLCLTNEKLAEGRTGQQE